MHCHHGPMTDQVAGRDTNFQAIVIGAGHNGLVTAAYLAKAGLRTLLLEARDSVGGCASSEDVLGARVNICNCDHITFRTTPVAEELDLAKHGLRYLDVDPAALNIPRSGAAWFQYGDVERTIDELGRSHPDQADGYRRYMKAAGPAAKLVLEAATAPPSIPGLVTTAVRKGLPAAITLLRWSRMSAADVMRQFFTKDELLAPPLAVGPFVWGMSPEAPGTGLGALKLAMSHVATIGRPEGGSGMLPTSLAAAYASFGGVTRTGARVERIRCEADRVRGVTLAGGEELDAAIVVSACDPRRTFVDWLADAPAGAESMVARWRAVHLHEGYESKLDAVLSEAPMYPALADHPDADSAMIPTAVVAPTLAEMDQAAKDLPAGKAPRYPVFLANVPTTLDPSMAPAGRHVFSLEVLLTPYGIAGGWPGSAEPQRWLEQYATIAQPGFLDSIVDYRVMTPDRYESDFNLPFGHATSFAGGPLAALRSRQPELTRYETAVPGLYLTGAATFPGAGVWGASGRNCAQKIIKRL